jgi:tetratricopeptide (TPR) repeat protein
LADSLQEIRLVDPSSGETLLTLQSGETGRVDCAAFSSDGSALAATAERRFLAVWDLRRIRSRLESLGLAGGWPTTLGRDLPVSPSPAALEIAPSPWLEPEGRVDPLARAGRWHEAAAKLDEALALGDDRFNVRHARAILQLRLGELDAYRRCCEGSVPVPIFPFHHPADDLTAAWISTLGPNPADVRAAALTLTSRLIESGGVGTTTFASTVPGAALYRAGRLTEAVEILTRATKPAEESLAYTWAFLALAHHDLGHFEEARLCLKQADQPSRRPDMIPFWDEVEADILRREAAAKIQRPVFELPVDVFAP